ncbi:acyl-coenzyme A diphosphatase NUDT19 [Moschus berezovskii]|uniref:acyl-coenzyme A diphosphatase NUDT19 n=1 Tax=Moschus berezovskii TaxID=68408 RepID=UPI002444210B|nr:acyl-coenzyme A diphosphatase NUDT19 [Moschus berezovskii]
MSVPVRAAPSNWRRAATIMLVAGWPRPVPTAPSRPQPPPEGFRVLLLQRSSNQGFVPGACVFPGGVLDAADRSTDWLCLFAPHHGPPRFGLGPAPPQLATFPVLPTARPEAVGEGAAALPDDIAFRICAIREAFEEAGVLLLRPRGPGARDQAPGCALAPPPALTDWRARVRRDPRLFLKLCAQLDCTPDIWALRDWSGWITPFLRPGTRRFETAFFLCCLSEPPQVFPDLVEVVDCKWSSPSEALESLISKEMSFAPPQFYELRRLGNFASFSDLHKFSLDRESEGTVRWMPIILLTADGMIHLLPGDEMYLEDSNFLENCMSTEKKTEEIMNEGEKFHRIVLYNSRNFRDCTGYSIHVTVLPKHRHVYPKSFVMGRSRL